LKLVLKASATQIGAAPEAEDVKTKVAMTMQAAINAPDVIAQTPVLPPSNFL